MLSSFANLRLAVRLGVAFGALVVALVVTAALSINGAGGIDADARELSQRDVAAFGQLVTISEDFLAADGDVLRHLYVEDGDVAAQDKTAKSIAAWGEEADAAIAALEPKLDSPEAKRALAGFTASYNKFADLADKAVELSRQETVDGVEERDGSRTVYTEQVRPALEGLDVQHDKLEGMLDEQAAEQ